MTWYPVPHMKSLHRNARLEEFPAMMEILQPLQQTQLPFLWNLVLNGHKVLRD